VDQAVVVYTAGPVEVDRAKEVAIAPPEPVVGTATVPVVQPMLVVPLGGLFSAVVLPVVQPVVLEADVDVLPVAAPVAVADTVAVAIVKLVAVSRVSASSPFRHAPRWHRSQAAIIPFSPIFMDSLNS
jgi:hypothetical protein